MKQNEAIWGRQWSWEPHVAQMRQNAFLRGICPPPLFSPSLVLPLEYPPAGRSGPCKPTWEKGGLTGALRRGPQWGLVAGSSFELLEGATEGQTQCDHPLPGELTAWAHPVDVHYTCRGLSGWPKLHVQVWGQDGFGRVGIQGYGF